MISHHSCPLCDSEGLTLLFRATDHFLSREVFPVMRCESCGFTFTNDYPAADAIHSYYDSEEYISHSGTSKGLVNKVYHLARYLMLRRKRALVTKFSALSKGSILDVGSGAGHFASVMKDAGWQVRGIEINTTAREHSIAAFGLDIIDPEYRTSLPESSFDCITMWHVLEHFHDPQAYMADLRRLLKPGGVMIVALPNIASADAVAYGASWAALDVPRHLWHFDPATFALFAGETGFSVSSRKVLPLDVFYISALSEKYRGSSFPFPAGILRAVFFTIRTLFRSDSASSLVYFLRKKEDQ